VREWAQRPALRLGAIFWTKPPVLCLIHNKTCVQTTQSVTYVVDTAAFPQAQDKLPTPASQPSVPVAAASQEQSSTSEINGLDQPVAETSAAGAAAAVAAVPAVAGIEAAAALAAAAGAEVDEDGILITEQHKREARLAYFGANVSRMSACLTMGGALVAVDRAALAQANVSLVINAAADVVPSAFRHEGVPYIALYVTDSASTELSAVFPALCSAIQAAESSGRTAFVHCHQGVSRSGAIICAYLMYRWGLSADDAILAARKCRGTVSPNAGFRVQLHQWGQWLQQWRGTQGQPTIAWAQLPSNDSASAVSAVAPEGVTVPSRCLDVGASMPASSVLGALAYMFAVVPLPVNVQIHTALGDSGVAAYSGIPSLCSVARGLLPGTSPGVHASDEQHKTRDESLHAITEENAARMNFATQHVRCAVVAVRHGPLRVLTAPHKACLVPDAVVLVQTSANAAYSHEAIPHLAIWVGKNVSPSFVESAVAAAQAEVAAWAHLIPALVEHGWIKEDGVPVLVQGTAQGDAFLEHMPVAAPVHSQAHQGGEGGLSASHRAALEASYQAQGISTARGSATSRGAAPPPMADPAPMPPAAVLSVLRSVSEAAARRAAAGATVSAPGKSSSTNAPVASILPEADSSEPSGIAAAGAGIGPPLAPRGGAHEVEEDEEAGNPSMSLGRPSLYRLTQLDALSGGLLPEVWERLGEYDHEDLEEGGVFALVAVGDSPPEEPESDGEDDVDPFALTVQEASNAKHRVWLWLGPGVPAATAAKDAVLSSVLAAHYGSRGVAAVPSAVLANATMSTQVHEQEDEEFWDWFSAGF